MYDPILHMRVAEAHLAELRAEAAVRRQMEHRVPGWRRVAGGAMVAAGRRLLGDVHQAIPLTPASDCCD